MNWFKRFFGKWKDQEAPVIIDPQDEETEKEKMARLFFDEKKMPCCGSDSFLGGPCGGIMMNIQCSKCGARFNISPVQFRIIEKI